MRTALFDHHKALAAKIVDFSGWEMPLHYSKGALHEHSVVRQSAGLFDVSHMGRVVIEGPDAESFLDYVATNKIAGKKVGSVTYTVLCHHDGGAVDDALIYRHGEELFSLVANAANRDKDFSHLIKQMNNFDVQLSHRYDEDGILALQGPHARDILQKILPDLPEMRPMRVEEVDGLVIASTGYTGEAGFEIFAPNTRIVELWEAILEMGSPFGVEPVGLAARDSLRLEAGFCLYGHEISDTISPIESIASWTVKLDKQHFVGKEALQALHDSPQHRQEVGLLLLEPGVARADYPVLQEGQEIGKITSGGYSPSLDQSIAIALINHPVEEGEKLRVQVRKRQLEAQVVKLPFLKMVKQ